MESVETQEHQGKVLTLSVYEIDTNPDQPRKTFDEEKLAELAESIRRHGIVQPLVVAPKGQRYIIVAGERRFRAARLAGLKTVPAICMEAEEGALQEVSLIENIQREDLNPVEEAAAIRFLMEQHDLTQEEVAQRISKSRPVVANSLRLLTLPKSIQTLMKEGKLSAGHGKILAGLEDKKQAEELGKRAAEENWSVRRLEDTLRLLNANRSRKKPGIPICGVWPEHSAAGWEPEWPSTGISRRGRSLSPIIPRRIWTPFTKPFSAGRRSKPSFHLAWSRAFNETYL